MDRIARALHDLTLDPDMIGPSAARVLPMGHFDFWCQRLFSIEPRWLFFGALFHQSSSFPICCAIAVVASNGRREAMDSSAYEPLGYYMN